MNPVLPFGFEYPSPTMDSIYGRALSGVWAIDGSRLLVAPWLQSDESVVIEWQGTKANWAPDDLVPDDITVQDAVAFYVAMCYERDFGCNMERMAMYKQQHDGANADLLWTCREETQVRATRQTPAEGQAAWAAYNAGETQPPDAATAEAPVVVAFIADYGFVTDASASSHPMAVAELVKSWNPAAIVTGGDNNYPSGEAATIDANIGSLYRSFIFPFNGTEALWAGETAATVNKFWPALGNHDWDGDSNTGQPYFDYFDGVLPASPRVGHPGEPRFYEVVLGPMHFFVLNSGYDTAGTVHEPLGIVNGSLQQTWLAERAALSTAPFKIVVVHHPPWTSASNYRPGFPALRWNFAAMGIDLVLSGHGHNYERIANEVWYVVCGASGSDLVTMGVPVPGSEVRIDDTWGAVRLTADCDVMTVEFVDEAGNVMDTLTLPDANVPIPLPAVTVATPTFDPVQGSYLMPLSVTLLCATPGVTMYYTLDDTAPTVASLLFDPLVPIVLTEPTTIRVIAVKEDMENSLEGVAVYGLPTVAAPVFAPTLGTFFPTVSITLTCATVGNSMFWTDDGSEPDQTGTPYTVPIVKSATATIKVKAYATGYNPSPTVPKTYTLVASFTAYWGNSTSPVLDEAALRVMKRN